MDWSNNQINNVWEKALKVNSNDPNIYRKDKCGAWIKKSLHASTGTFGWEIDHIKASANGGGNQLSNLQPLHWKNNRSKADGNDIPKTYCVVKSNGTTNIGL